MRSPLSWNDRGLLDDEPFLTEFRVRTTAPPPTRLAHTGLDWVKRTVDELRKTDAGVGTHLETIF